MSLLMLKSECICTRVAWRMKLPNDLRITTTWRGVKKTMMLVIKLDAAVYIYIYSIYVRRWFCFSSTCYRHYHQLALQKTREQRDNSKSNFCLRRSNPFVPASDSVLSLSLSLSWLLFLRFTLRHTTNDAVYNGATTACKEHRQLGYNARGI